MKKACQNALSVLPFRPTEVKSNWLKIIATLAEASAIKPHFKTPRIQLINQGYDSVALVRDLEGEAN